MDPMDFENQDLRNVDLRALSLKGANLRRADLMGADLAGLDLSTANLEGAKLVRANLKKADLSGANLKGADLTAACLLGANLNGATMAGASLRRAKLIGARLDVKELERADTFGAALPSHPSASAIFPKFLQPAMSAVWGDTDDLIFTGTFGLISVWDAATQQRIRSWEPHPGSLGYMRLAYSTTERVLASCGGDSKVKLWDVTSAQELKSFATGTSQAYQLLFAPSGELLVSGRDGVVELRNAATGEHTATLPAHKTAVEALAISRDGRLAASGDVDGTIHVSEIPSGRSVRTFQRKGKVHSLAFSPDGGSLASTSCGNPIESWKIAPGKEWQWPNIPSAHCLAYSPDGEMLATAGEHGTSVWNTANGSLIREMPERFSMCILGIAFSPQGKTLAGASSFLVLWDWETSPRTEDVTEHTSGPVLNGLAIHDKTLVIATHKAIIYWDLRQGIEVRRDTIDEDKLIRTIRDGLRSKKAGDGELQACAKALGFTVGGGFFTYDGRTEAPLFLSSSSYNIELYHLNRGGDAHRLRDRRGQCINCVAIDPMGCYLAHGGSDGRIVLWSLLTLNRLRSKREHPHTRALCFSRDGSVLASGGSDALIKLFDATSGQVIHTLAGHSRDVVKVVFSPTSQILASSAHDYSVKLWDAATGQLLRSISTTNLVTGLVFDASGSHVLMALGDHTVRAYKVETGECVTTILPMPEGSAVFDAKHRYRCSGNSTGQFWHAIGLCRFEAGELDEFLPELSLPPGESIWGPLEESSK